MTVPTVVLMIICVITAFVIGMIVMHITHKSSQNKQKQAMLGTMTRPARNPPKWASMYMHDGLMR
jgi:hypothetical protein